MISLKPICNSDVPVDSSLFGADCMKQMKELGDYTKIPIANPRFLGRGSRSNINSAPSNYSRDHYQSLNSRGPVGRQGGRQFPSLRGRGRGFPTGNRGSQRDVIQRDDYLTSIDLTDAYFSISINNDFKRYLRFMWKGRLYEFQVLCFGLASAPRVFTKVLKPVYAFFRKNGIRCIYYIDDSLVMDQNLESCIVNTEKMVQKLDELGFRINYKKSVLIPSKRIVFFGLIIDTELFKIFLTDEKIDKIISLGKIILQQKCVTVRCFASFIGLVVHAFNAVSVGPLHYRNMERNKVGALNSCNGDFDSEIFITQESRTEIFWWVNNLKSENGKLIRPIQINFWIETDASLEGWGAKFEGQFAGGRWSLSERSFHINFLELLAIFFSL
ncbi:Hypothetical predicted protein [Mytilus galloprovincialis]|uniref:Reverse transcriptase domain-containing protein n=1 Tax=Mytilus galloprovincialis TaxID=29158 RepID=A0A8B6DT81_MYTGA|nr:Hypothetical predicted protein [Mytilus galloprovincialis]